MALSLSPVVPQFNLQRGGPGGKRAAVGLGNGSGLWRGSEKASDHVVGNERLLSRRGIVRVLWLAVAMGFAIGRSERAMGAAAVPPAGKTLEAWQTIDGWVKRWKAP